MDSSEGRSYDEVYNGNRLVKVVLCDISSPNIDRLEIHSGSTFSHILNELQSRGHANAVILEGHFGPRSYFSVKSQQELDTTIPNACHTIYAVVDEGNTEYALAVMRTPIADYPLPIFNSKHNSDIKVLQAVRQAVAATRPDLVDKIKLITDFSNDADLANERLDFNSRIFKKMGSGPVPTVFFITMNHLPQLRSDITAVFIPPFLQMASLRYSDLLDRVKKLRASPHRTQHLLEAAIHLILSLAVELETMLEGEDPVPDSDRFVDKASEELLTVAPQLGRQLNTIMDGIQRIVKKLEDGRPNPDIEEAIDRVYSDLCGDFPGAVAVRHAEYTCRKKEGWVLCIHVEPDEALRSLFQAVAERAQRPEPAQPLFRIVDKYAAELNIAFENNQVVFNILDPFVTAYGVNRLYSGVAPTVDEVFPVLCAADRYFWHLRIAGNARLSRSEVLIELLRLKQGDLHNIDLTPIWEPVGQNLVKEGVADIVVDNNDAYGIRLTNQSKRYLYMSLMHFDCSDLTIGSHLQPTDNSSQIGRELSPLASITIGYDAEGGMPFNCTLHDGMNVDVSFLKLFISTEPLNTSNIRQSSQLRGSRRKSDMTIRNEEKSSESLQSVLVTVVHRRTAASLYEVHPMHTVPILSDSVPTPSSNVANTEKTGFPRENTIFYGSSLQTPQTQYFRPIDWLSRQLAGSSFSLGLSGETESPQVSPDPNRSASAESNRLSTSRTQRDGNENRQPNPPNRRRYASSRGPGPVAPPSLPRSHIPDRPDRSESPPVTPSGTEGSDDPEQDEDEPTSPIASTSTLIPSPATVRWARFNVPEDVFLNPPDPGRRQLYYQIRQEPWFLDQTLERPITGEEAARIPGSVPGESVLLAFYDRVPDGQGNRKVMRCTICMQTNQNAHLYPRPDRARVHMRHHFELRPVPCNGQCNIRHCRQRFFTNGDLNAHVAGKTEPLVKCEYCAKPLRSKNLQRHIDHFCHRVPPGMGRGSHA